mmetsp:Transcript_19009/g.37515  ORF Transcript_19009/g.37515 Transcript_19009/m.37515 type:complete len:327 (+) Transcript_19009:225-1205(+)
MKSSTPAKDTLTEVRKLHNVQIGGVTGAKTKLELQGQLRFFPDHPGIPALWIPGSPYLIVSISQFLKSKKAHGYFGEQKAYIWNPTAGVIGSATVRNGLYFQDLDTHKISMEELKRQLLTTLGTSDDGAESKYVECLSSIEELKQLHDAYNHLAFDRIRQLHNYPPASQNSPNPVCEACQQSGIRRPNVTQSSKEGASRPWQHISMDISRKMPSDRRGHHRYIIAQCMRTDAWLPLIFKRKSEVLRVVREMIVALNNKYLPNKVSKIFCDADTMFVKDEKFKAMLKSHGVELRPAPPNDQAKKSIRECHETGSKTDARDIREGQYA